MKINLSIAAGVASALGLAAAAHAALPAEIVVNGEHVFPESITSSADGAVYFGSIGNKAVYKAAPGSDKAELFVQPGTDGLQSTFGVFADDRTHTLWVCSNVMGGPPGGAPNPPGSLYAFDLGSGATKGHYPFPTAGAMCNDIATLPDGTVFATDTGNTQVVTLKKGAGELTVWAGADGSLGPKNVVIDGISVLGNHVVVNELAASKLFSIPLEKDGSAGKPAEIKTDKPISRPDGMRAFGRNGVLIIEGGDGGKLEHIRFDHDLGEGKVELIKQGYPDGPVAVAVVGTTAYVAESQFAAMRGGPGSRPGAAPVAEKPFKATAVELPK